VSVVVIVRSNVECVECGFKFQVVEGRFPAGQWPGITWPPQQADDNSETFFVPLSSFLEEVIN
jgi:hypothetical protein